MSTEPHIYRAIRLKLPSEVHAIVHDETLPKSRRAGALADYLCAKPVGWHWSSEQDGAMPWAAGSGRGWWAKIPMPTAPDVTALILRARHPGRPGRNELRAGPETRRLGLRRCRRLGGTCQPRLAPGSERRLLVDYRAESEGDILRAEAERVGSLARLYNAE